MERFASGPLTPIISISNSNRIQIPVYENKLPKKKEYWFQKNNF